MLREVHGDILLTKSTALAHGVAVDDDFKQGLALALRERWPAMYKDFRHYCKTQSPKPGDVWAWKGPGSPIIYNLLTQEPPKHAGDRPGKATLANLNHALQNLAKTVTSENVATLAITKIATGVGGLDWTEVKALLQHTLGGLKTTVSVYATYSPKVAAE